MAEKIFTLSPSADRLSPDKLRALSSSRKAKLISNRMADYLLTEPLSGIRDSPAWPICTGTCVAYAAPRQKLGDAIECQTRRAKCVLDTKAFRKLADVALVLEDYDIVMDKGWRVYIPKGEIVIVEAFPAQNGWYGVDERTRIPYVSAKKNSRFLWRSSGAWIDHAVRDYGSDGRARYDIFLHTRVPYGFGAFAFQ